MEPEVLAPADGDEFEVWECALCEEGAARFGDPRAFSEHVEAAHPELPAGWLQRVQGVVSVHLDGRDWYEWQYRWLLPETQQELARSQHRYRREGDDLLRRV